ncbi:MAG: HDOD domain-containing protein [Rhodocyclaceae bacterium]|jgi:HD-like signal output (HDOD) protein|nr:HDOD domain-containing protein [Rhodocyclaceae bacterium]
MEDSLDFTVKPQAAPPPPPPPPAAAGGTMSKLSERLDSLDLTALPRISPVASKLAALKPSELESTKVFCAIIEQEPICVARLIGLANSVAFGIPGKKFNALDQAVNRIGLERAAQTAFGMLCGQALNKGLSPQWRDFLWMHAMAVAYGASMLATKVAPAERANAYLAGMIYDIGTLVIECLRPGTLDLLLETAVAREMKLGQVEQVMLGKARRAVSTALLRKWSLPDEITGAVAEREVDVIEPDSLSAILAVADELARSEVVMSAVYADTAAPFPLEAVMLDCVSDRTASLLSIDADVIETIGERLSNQVVALRATAESFSSAG